MLRNLDRLWRDLIAPPAGMPAVDFSAPAGASALFDPESVTWRVMKNPVALLIGGVTAVLLELAEPRVRTGVWEHTRFREDPVGRIRRTGFAAMATVYAPAEAARGMIERISQRHARIAGATPAGLPFSASDPELLNWVHTTASFGFLEAYQRFVRPLSPEKRDRFYAEGRASAELYGAASTPQSHTEALTLFQTMRPKLEASEIVFDFLSIMRQAPLLPAMARPLQSLALHAAAELIPPWARDTLGLDRHYRLSTSGVIALRALGAAADRIVLKRAPPAQACVRMGLPAEFLYRG